MRLFYVHVTTHIRCTLAWVLVICITLTQINKTHANVDLIDDILWFQRAFKDDELASLLGILRKLEIVCNFRQKLREATDCSFIYWHRVIFPIYLADVFEQTIDASRYDFN